jgi:TatD DNase family protein
LIDTHAHLDAPDAPAAELLARAREAGVGRVIAVGCGIESSRATLEIADREEGVFAALGFHPHQAGEPADLDGLRELLTHPKAVAVGETGLDHYRDYAPHDAQETLFRQQIALAGEVAKPLVVHTRAADADTVALLREATVPVVLHCFSSSELLAPALEYGWYISFAGNVTYPKAGDLRWAAERVPAERILAETDSPYLSPQPVRGRPNEPANVLHTLAALADLRGTTLVELDAQIEANATEVFGLP